MVGLMITFGSTLVLGVPLSLWLRRNVEETLGGGGGGTLPAGVCVWLSALGTNVVGVTGVEADGA